MKRSGEVVSVEAGSVLESSRSGISREGFRLLRVVNGQNKV